MEITILKTDAEILHEIKTNNKNLFCYNQDLIEFLSYENAKEFLTEDATEEIWNNLKKELTKEVVINEIKSYLPFAFEKATNKRGLSACRSIEHMQAWAWLLDDSKLIEILSDTSYNDYGLAILHEVEEYVKENG